MGIRVGLTLFSVVALMIIFGMNQDAYAGFALDVEVQKTTTSGDGVFTFDLIGVDFSGGPTVLDTCSIDTQSENTCTLSGSNASIFQVIERAQAGWMQDSTTCPGDIFASQISSVICEFVNSPKSAIGGEIIPLDTTIVLVAGSQYTAAWMIPVIVSGIGFAIVIARKF